MAVKVNGEKYEENNIIGTEDNEVIKGGTINDTIQGGLGADTITGGTGENLIKYTTGDGNDVINLTKGENFTLSLEDVTNIDNVKFEFVKNDLRIYADNTNLSEYITIKNFVSKDVTNNGNAKKGIDDTSSVELLVNGETYDLRKMNILSGTPMFISVVDKNYTGSWLSEGITAQDYTKYTDKEKTIINTDYTSKGLSINGKDGENWIIGSNYSDTIKAGKDVDSIKGGLGNDVITAGAGANNIIYSIGDGNDVINLTKGENITITLTNAENISDVKFEFVKNDLRIYSDKDNLNEYITIKNFVAKDVTNNSNAKKGIDDTSSVELLVNGETYDLRNAIYDIDGDSEKDYFYQIKTVKNHTGSWLGEFIDANAYEPTKGTKGLTLDGKGGDDVVIGSDYNDVIKGGDGDDYIDCYEGNDTITGGTGKNIIDIYEGEGNDVINLTKSENLTISLQDVGDIEDVRFEFVKNDLRIYHNSSDENNYLTIKNFVAKDVTNNSDAKKGIEDTSSVMLEIDGETYDLREHFYNVSTTKNYTGSWLNEQIIGLGYKKYDKKGLLITDNAQKGLSLNGKDGDDFIVGSIYSDTIKGGNGDDFIIGGTGNDKLYGEAGKNTFVFNVEDGADTIYKGKGEDTVVFNGVDYINSIEQVKKGSKDAVISYGDKGDTVTIKDFYTIDKKAILQVQIHQ